MAITRIERGRWCLAIWLAGAHWASTANAQTWRIEPSAIARTTATSNSGFADSNDLGGDVVLTLTPRLTLTGWHGFQTGAHDFNAVGGQVDCHGEGGGGQGGQLDTDAWQTEKDEEKLHDKGRVADQFDINADQSLRPNRTPAPRCRTADA